MGSMPFRGSVAVARGEVTAGQLRGPRFRRLFPDVYVPGSPRPPGLAVRSRAAFLLVAGRDGVLAGYSAALLLGADCAPRNAPAEVIVPRDLRRHAGLLVHRGRVAGPDRWRAGGCVVTSPLRTAWDLTRRLVPDEAVVALDALAHLRDDERRPYFVPQDLLARRAAQPGARGCRRLDEIVALAEPDAESPMETRMRLLLIRASLPRPVVQHEFVDETGYVLARFDLAYPAARLAIEYDGLDHADRALSNDDRWRDGETGRHGWHTMRFTHRDIVTTPRRTVMLVERQLELRTPASAT